MKWLPPAFDLGQLKLLYGCWVTEVTSKWRESLPWSCLALKELTQTQQEVSSSSCIWRALLHKSHLTLQRERSDHRRQMGPALLSTMRNKLWSMACISLCLSLKERWIYPWGGWHQKPRQQRQTSTQCCCCPSPDTQQRAEKREVKHAHPERTNKSVCASVGV